LRTAAPRPTLFPYTTLFRSLRALRLGRIHQHPVVAGIRHVEPAGTVHREGIGLIDLAEGRAIGNQGPVPLGVPLLDPAAVAPIRDRKSTRLNSSHVAISYAV